MTEQRPVRQRSPRLIDDAYLIWLRQQRCACGCLQPPPCDAAHIRSGSLKYNKPPLAGMAMKPDDRWALPLKHAHHMAQHAHGDELGWWRAHGVNDVFALALDHVARYLKENPDAPAPRVQKRRRAKMKRTAPRSRPMPGTKASGIKRRMNGEVIRR
jgi:hypothetical protein